MTDDVTTLVLRVSLDDVEPGVWRVVEVAGLGTLGWLHETLVAAMGWENSHLHSFMVGGTWYSPVIDRIETIGEDEESVTIVEALPEVGSSITWRYDWGDNWDHTITVEAIGTMQLGVTYPVLHDGARACPPEDCGGAFIYMEILRMLEDPDYRPDVVGREETMEWIGPDFDPDVFHIPITQWHMHNPAPKDVW